MLCLRSTFALVLASSLACIATARASSRAVAPSSAAILLAQNFQPPGAVPDADQGYGQTQSSDSAALLIRIDRLEDQVRALNGQIEQLQFNQHRLEDALRKFQGDVDFRFQDVEHGKGSARAPSKRSDASDGDSGYPAPSQDAAAAPAPRHDDAFSPADHPDAPGSPHVLGTLPNEGLASSDSAPADQGGAAGDDDAGAPLQLDNGPMPQDTGANSGADAAAVPAGPLARSPQASAGDAATGATVLADLPSSTPREDFDLGLVSYNNGQFDQAQTAFRGFLEKHPKDRLTPEAVYYLGESYWRLGRMREAAEQYLKISTDYAKSSHAPDSLLKLGMSLEKLGSRDQACASWAQIGRKYPNAAAPVRASAERDMKRDQC